MKEMKSKRYFYPGSFNLLHHGHLAIAHYIERKYNQDVEFEICTCPMDKEPLSIADCDKRLKQFKMLGRICHLSKATTFLEKTMTYANSCGNDQIYFMVGMDTISRIDDPKYYLNSKDERDRCLILIKRFGGSFIVFPRVGFETHIPSPEMNNIIEFVTDFTPVDVSSTEIRNSQEVTNRLKLEALKEIRYGTCVRYDGNLYKTINDDKYLNSKVTLYNGAEFIPFNWNTVVEVTDIKAWPLVN